MKILAFDIESCTGAPWDGSLCSFGYVLAENGVAVRQEDILVNPLPKFFTLGKFGEAPTLKLAYPVSVFRSSPRFNARFSAIKGLFEEADLVIGFSVQNDMKYLNNACDAFSLPRINFEFLDVQVLAGLALPEYKNMGLRAVAAHYGIEFTEHRSDEDARATYEIFLKLLEISGGNAERLIEKFSVVKGKNGAAGHVNCYSIEDVRSRLVSGGKSVKKILVQYYGKHAGERVARRGDLFENKTVGVSEYIYAPDTPLARKIIATAAAEGGTFDSSLQSCDYFVAAENDKAAYRVKKINRGCKILSVGEFEEICGGLIDCEFDDFAVLTAHYGQLYTDRETPVERAARLAKKKANGKGKQ